MINEKIESTYVEDTAGSNGPQSIAKEGDDIDINQGNEAVLLHVGTAVAINSNVRLAKDGHTVLVPQPSDDPDDPLNWSWAKKHTILFIVALAAFGGDFGSGSGIPCVIPQAAEWGLTPVRVNYSGNLNVIMLGLGGLFWIPPIYFWGRAPVLFWTQLLGTFFTLGCCVAPDFPTFYAFRALMGFTLTACQVVGLSFIKDMFYFHEHARKIGLWAAAFLLSPYCGPLFGNFIIAKTGNWRICFWVVFAVTMFDLILIVLFADETWYRRDIRREDQPSRGSRLLRVIGIWQIRAPGRETYFLSLAESLSRLWSVLLKPIMFPTMIYYGLSFMWAIGINIMSSILLSTPAEAGGYGFGPEAVGFVYFTPIVAVTLGELFGHYFNDYLATRYTKRHQGIFKPEARLPSCLIGVVFMVPGLIVVGQALRHLLPYPVVIIGWGLYVFGVMIASVAITAYVLDCYPTGAGEVSAFLNLARTLCGFSVGYFQVEWGQASGYDVSFGIQAVIVAVASLVVIAIMVYGERLRRRGGPLKLRG